MLWLVFGYHLALLALAYWFGRDSAGRGVFLFIGGAVVFQVVMLGPMSLLEPSGCNYGVYARDC